MSLSCDAQIFLIGLWTEADDQGVFDWKPLTLRQRLRGGKDGDVNFILSELADANCIKRWEINGRQLGAIRNFRKFQRPKYPNATHVITDDVRNYVGLTQPIPPTDEDEEPPLPSSGGKSPQMEEGGDTVEGKEGKKKTKYAFEGRVIRLVRADYDTWKKTNHAIPDFEAELRRIDDSLRQNPPKDWFPAVSAMLNAKHQKLVGLQAPARRGGVTPMHPGAGG